MKQNYFENADWIFVDYDGSQICDEYFEYCTSFEISSVSKTTLFLCSYSQYAVYINGTFVNCGQYDGYEDYQVYDVLDITQYLQEGTNELYIGHYVCGWDFSTRQKQIPGLIFSIYNENSCLLVSDCKCLSRKNEHFLKNGEKISNQLGFNFEYDANQKENLYKPSILAGKEKHLVPRPIEKLCIAPFETAKLCAQGIFVENKDALCKAERMQTAYLSACGQNPFFTQVEEGICWSVPTDKCCDGVYMIFDLQKESAGLLEFTLDVPEEVEVLIGFGEHLEDLRVRSFVGGRNFCFRYVAKKGHQTFFYPYQRMGLRYLQFHVLCKEGMLQAGIRKQNYPLTKYELSLKDQLHRQIYQGCVNTLELCMHEHYEDCPWREQALYAMDSRVQMLCGYYTFQEYAFPRVALILMARSLREDNLLELCAPGKVSVNIPSFTAVFVRQVLEYVEYAKDWSLAEELFPTLKKIVEGFASRIASNHLIPLYCGQEYWNFYEWTEGMVGKQRHQTEVFESPLNAFVSDAFRCFAKICEKMDPDLASKYVALHEKMNQAMHEIFFDVEHHGYLTRLGDENPKHVLTQGLLLYANAVPQEYQETVALSIMDGTLLPCSVSMTIYVYEALLGLGNECTAYVLQEIERIWGEMLLSGADTFWETEKGAVDFDNAGSLCHGWSAVPSYLFGKYGRLLGILSVLE